MKKVCLTFKTIIRILINEQVQKLLSYKIHMISLRKSRVILHGYLHKLKNYLNMFDFDSLK